MNTQLLYKQHPWRPSFENSVDTAIRSEANQGLLRTREHGEAAFRRGNHYLVAKDATKAIRWYQRAATAGHMAAQYNLGLLYLKGEGIAQAALKGLEWITTAAESGDGKAQALLRRIDQALVAK